MAHTGVAIRSRFLTCVNVTYVVVCVSVLEMIVFACPMSIALDFTSIRYCQCDCPNNVSTMICLLCYTSLTVNLLPGAYKSHTGWIRSPPANPVPIYIAHLMLFVCYEYATSHRYLNRSILFVLAWVIIDVTMFENSSWTTNFRTKKFAATFLALSSFRYVYIIFLLLLSKLEKKKRVVGNQISYVNALCYLLFNCRGFFFAWSQLGGVITTYILVYVTIASYESEPNIRV